MRTPELELEEDYFYFLVDVMISIVFGSIRANRKEELTIVRFRSLILESEEDRLSFCSLQSDSLVFASFSET